MSIKHHLKKILYSKRFARVTVLSALRLHNFSYKVVSIFAPHIEADGLHPKHRIMKYHDFFLDNLSGTDEVLDVGCGNGALSVDIARKTNKVVGIDIVCVFRRFRPLIPIHSVHFRSEATTDNSMINKWTKSVKQLLCFSHRFPLQIDLIGIVSDAV